MQPSAGAPPPPAQRVHRLEASEGLRAGAGLQEPCRPRLAVERLAKLQPSCWKETFLTSLSLEHLGEPPPPS